MRLYEFGPTRSMRVRWTLQELGIPFDAVSVNLITGEHRRPDYLKINPAGKVPTLIDGDRVLTESIACVLYLGDKYPDRGLVPTNVGMRAELIRWLLFTATELEQPLWRIARHTNLYPPEKRLAQEVAIARDDFTQMAVVLDAHMRDRRFVLGDDVGVGDFVLAHTLDWANEVKLLADAPRLRTYIETMFARPHAPPRIAAELARVAA